MKILIFTLEYPPMLGGAGTYAKELADGFNELGHNVDVLTSNRGISGDFEEGVTYNIFRENWSSRLWFFQWPQILRKRLDNNSYDLVIFANQAAIIVGAKITKINVPYSCTLHGSERYTFLAQNYDLKTRLLVKRPKLIRFLINANKVICVSMNLLNDVDKLINFPATLEHIPLGISNNFSFSNRQPVNNNVINVVCTARFVKGKGQEKVLYAVNFLKKNFDKTVRLIFIGNGPEEHLIKEMTRKLNLVELVEFKGLLSREKIYEVYQEMDVFIMLSSFKETFGLVYLEAMFSGLPVIGSNLGAVGDLINDDNNGYLIDLIDQTPENISRLILKAYNNKERLGKSSLKKSKDFSNITMAKRHLQ